MYQEQLFQTPNNKFGFVYLVTCTHPEYSKKYIGRKFFYTNFGKKTKQKESDWATYKTSSTYVKEAIKKYGLDYFTFEIIQLFDTRAGVVSAEVELQWAARVLHAVNEAGERIYINQAIGNIKFIAKEQLSEEHKQKLMGPKHNQSFKDELSNRSIGNKYNEGNKHSEVTKALIGKAAKKNNTKYRIVGINLSLKCATSYKGRQALIDAGFDPANVYRCCNGKQKTHKNNTFQYE
jgi:hypothetical protein